MTASSPWTPTPLDAHDSHDQQAYESAPHSSASAYADQPAPRRRRRWMWPVLGVLLLAAVGAAAWLTFLRPSPVVAAGQGVVDLTSEPEEAWTVKYAPRGEEEWIDAYPSLVAVGGDQIAVLAALDSTHYAAQSDSLWYSGYDEHYATGYADGQRYQEDYRAYEQDSWANDFPERADYFSISGATYDDYLSSSTYDGWGQGFNDATSQMPEGSSKAARPDDPPTMGRLTLLDARSGGEEWTVDLASLDVDGAASTVELAPLTPEGHLVLHVSTWSDTGTLTVRLFALDPDTGAVVSETELEGAAVATSSDPVAPLVIVLEDMAIRLDSADLDGDYLWSASIPDLQPSAPWLTDGLVRLSTDEGEWWLDAGSGYEPDWFEDAEPDITWRILADVVIRQEPSSFGTYLDALGHDGDTLWTDDAEEVYVVDGSGGEALLRAEHGADGESEFLMRLDPRTGEAMWEAEYDDSFSWVRGTVPGGLVVTQDNRGVLVDLESGERQHRLRGPASYLGTELAYGSEDGRVRAWDLEDGRELWSLRLSDSESLRSVGGQLLVHDSERRELALLQ